MKIIGQELAVIREHLGLSVSDIQHRTKLARDVIESIENGDIFDHKSENVVYLRIYIRSFARALKIDNSVIVKALDQLKNGNYNHLLLDYYPDLNRSLLDKKQNSDRRKEKVSGSSAFDSSTASSEDASSDADADADADTTTGSGVGLTPGAGSDSGASASTRSIKRNDSQRSSTLPGDEAGKEINWAQMGKQFNQPPKKFSWKKLFGWIVFVAAILASVYLFFTLL